MHNIEPKEYPSSNEQYINITGGTLATKFSIHKTAKAYMATAAIGNHDLVSYLNSLDYLTRLEKKDNYCWWIVDNESIIDLLNSVMRKFK